MKTTVWSLGLIATLAFVDDARACGGCFHLENLQGADDSVVTGHRMVFALSETRSVLWDQIRYSGSPKEFAWVLPVRPGAYIEPSTDAWFEILEAVTHTTVSPPSVTCTYPGYDGGYGYGYGSGYGSSGPGCGCSSDESTGSVNIGGPSGPGGPGGTISVAPPPPPVRVVHQGTVGPYETVTLSSKDGSALRTWLTKHGFAIPADISPIIDDYVSEGADFIALRLSPGTGVSAMTPVRVVTPEGPPILPLRMVAAGTGSTVDIVLYIIAEGRYGLLDLVETRLDWSKLTYDFRSDSSNYDVLRNTALAENMGASYLSTFAEEGAFGRPLTSVSVGVVSSDIPSLYFAQANVEEGRLPQFPESCSTPGFNSSKLVVETRAQGATDGGSSRLDAGRLQTDGGRTKPEGGAMMDSSGGSTEGGASTRDASSGIDSAADGAIATPRPSTVDSGLGPNKLGSFELVCEDHSDVAAALIGMHPSAVWLTRLEMELPREALIMDCRVARAQADSRVSNQITPGTYKGDPCPAGAVPSGGTAASFSAFPWASGSFTVLGLLRRRRRRVPS